jgi:hypothetical protein
MSILLVLIGLLWAAVLASGVWRRIGERQGVGSINHFHHQLQLLEQATPKTVAPAYRLHRAQDDVAAGIDSSRPRLVLLRPTNDALGADVAGNDGCHYERVGLLDHPEPVHVPTGGAQLPAYRRELARRRCMILLWGLCGVAILTGLIGMWPRLHVVWVVTALSGLAALGLVGLMAYARELETEMRIRRARAASRAISDEPHDPLVGEVAGKWDDTAEVQAAAR